MRRRPMSPLVPLLIVLLLLVGGVFLLSRSVSEQPTKVVEVDVAPDAAAH
ncbi:hypothetical protein [Sphingomonas sp.]|nr:hypothetical protein [Sphingomonas sp.]